ncbi:MAG: hypothetical protein IH594_09215, partial [Bacteroidales bacterium]|nr:hypothetical protein [Bacteroidales bacterium]
YHLKIHTIPPVEVDSVVVLPGKHSVIQANVPQGYLLVKTPRGKQYEGQEFFVRKNRETETLHTQEIGQVEKYLTGTYEIEIPSIPRIHIRDIEILQSQTRIINIPEPGLVTLSSKHEGSGSIYSLSNSGQEWILNLNSLVKQQAYLMQPGFYRVVFRNNISKSSLNTQVREFEVKEGQSLFIDM